MEIINETYEIYEISESKEIKDFSESNKIKYNDGLIADVYLLYQVVKLEAIDEPTRIAIVKALSNAINQIHNVDLAQDMTKIIECDQMLSYNKCVSLLNNSGNIFDSTTSNNRYDPQLVANIYLLEQLVLNDKIQKPHAQLIFQMINEIHNSNLTNSVPIIASIEMVGYAKYVHSNQLTSQFDGKLDLGDNVVPSSDNTPPKFDRGLVADLYLVRQIVVKDIADHKTMILIYNLVSAIHNYDLVVDNRNCDNTDQLLKSAEMLDYTDYVQSNQLGSMSKLSFDRGLCANLFFLTQLIGNKFVELTVASKISDLINQIHGIHTDLDPATIYKLMLNSDEFKAYNQYVATNQKTRDLSSSNPSFNQKTDIADQKTDIDDCY